MTISLHNEERKYTEKTSKKFKVIHNYYFEDYFEINPEEGSALGLDRNDNRVKDYSDQGYERELELNRRTIKKLKLLNPYQLTLDEHLDFVLLKSKADRFIFDHEHLPDYRAVKPQIYLPINGIYCMLFREMKDEYRLKSIISRLEKAPVTISQGKENLKNPPRIWTETTINQLSSVIKFFKNLPEIDVIKESGKNYPELLDQFIEANNKCMEALKDYDRFLNVELIERSSGEYCVGRQALDFYLKNDHFFEYASGYINELGYELIKKTEADIKSIAAKIDDTKTPEEIIKELEAQYSPPDKLLETYQQLVNKTKQFVKDNDLVSFPEKEELEIIYTPEYFRDIIPFAAYYCLGPYEPSNKGQLWVTPVEESDPSKEEDLLRDGHNLYKLPSLVLHETYPGHHQQLMLSKKVLFEEGSSTVRRASFSTLLIEGWAMYCEQMMGELGFYSDQQKLIALKSQLWRAVRVVLDIEIHSGRKSVQEAIAFLVSKVNMSEENAKAEVIRYTMTPTQPLSYEMGKRFIIQLREKEKIKLKDNFNLKDFHDKLLSKGNLPIKLIEEMVFHKEVELAK